MKWRKLGKIFDPRDYILPNNCKEFAKSPQAIVFDDFVRVYFCSTEKDWNNKYLSHVAYADFNKDFSKIIKVSDRNVIELGELGSFDEHGIFPINVLKNEHSIIAYTTGWSRRVSVSVETSVGMALSSNNGETFSKIGNGPVLTSSLYEPFLVCDSFVTKFNDVFHMWYIFGKEWINDSIEKEPERVYKIAHATSIDGVAWKKDGRCIIPDKLNIHECQALPTVLHHNNFYHMFFCYREATDFRKNPDRAYRIGYAFSEDLISWKRDDENVGIDVSKNGWDSEMQCYPHVFRLDGKIYMLYNGNDFGRHGFGIAVLEE